MEWVDFVAKREGISAVQIDTTHVVPKALEAALVKPPSLASQTHGKRLLHRSALSIISELEAASVQALSDIAPPWCTTPRSKVLDSIRAKSIGNSQSPQPKLLKSTTHSQFNPVASLSSQSP